MNPKKVIIERQSVQYIRYLLYILSLDDTSDGRTLVSDGITRSIVSIGVSALMIY